MPKRILAAIALAMAVAAIVLGTLGSLTLLTSVILLGIGIMALALALLKE
jgi:hypothetical protein